MAVNLMAELHEKQAVALAERVGYAAYGTGFARAPALSPEVRAAVACLPVGDPLVVAVFTAYTKGYDKAASKAAEAALKA